MPTRGSPFPVGLPATLALVSIAGATALPVGSYAGTPREEARVLFQQGNQLLRRGEHRAALDKYEQALALLPTSRIHFNMAAAWHEMGRMAEAATCFARFLATADASVPKEMIRIARQRLDLLRPALAALEVPCKERNVTVLVDGLKVGLTPLGAPVYVRPGRRRITLAKKGHASVDQAIVFEKGGVRKVEGTPVPGPGFLWLPPSPRKSEPPREVAGRAGPAAARPDADRAAVERRRNTLYGSLFLGLGLACAASATVLFAVGAADGSEAHDRYMESILLSDITRYREELASAEDKVIAASVLTGTAAVALAVSGYLFWTRPATARRAAAPNLTPSVLVGSRGGEAVLSVAGEF